MINSNFKGLSFVPGFGKDVNRSNKTRTSANRLTAKCVNCVKIPSSLSFAYRVLCLVSLAERVGVGFTFPTQTRFGS